MKIFIIPFFVSVPLYFGPNVHSCNDFVVESVQLTQTPRMAFMFNLVLLPKSINSGNDLHETFIAAT